VEIERLALLVAASFCAGAINSVAGGGSLVSFPAAIFAGLSPVGASAANTVSQAPAGIAAAIAYRRELGDRKSLSLVLTMPAAMGSVVGAMALLLAPARVFEIIVPWLVLSATALIIVKDVLWKKAAARAERTRTRVALVGLGLSIVAIYGGYFGAGIGILTLALLALLGDLDIHELNAMKSVIVAGVNSAAAVVFLAKGAIHPTATLAMSIGAIAGAFGGASLARKASARKVRWLVVAIGVGLSVLLAVRYWRA
jgi:uncharacterized membrane protein YfcA